MRRVGSLEPVGGPKVFVEKRTRAAHPYVALEGFMILSVTGMKELDRRLSDRSLGMQAVRVLIAMATSCDYENRVRRGQKDLAAHLDMDQSDVSKAIRVLIECEFIERPQTSRGYYTISPRLMWKGSSRTLKLALQERIAA
jgi:hypothetical protein